MMMWLIYFTLIAALGKAFQPLNVQYFYQTFHNGGMTITIVDFGRSVSL